MCYLSTMLSFDLSAPWRELSLAVVDVETTALEAKEFRLIQLGIVRFERGQIAERWGQLIDPGCEIPAKITEITGITDEMVKGKPSFRDLKWDIYGRLRDRVLVAYNAPFDWGFLESEMKRAGPSCPCSIRWSGPGTSCPRSEAIAWDASPTSWESISVRRTARSTTPKPPARSCFASLTRFPSTLGPSSASRKPGGRNKRPLSLNGVLRDRLRHQRKPHLRSPMFRTPRKPHSLASRC